MRMTINSLTTKTRRYLVYAIALFPVFIALSAAAWAGDHDPGVWSPTADQYHPTVIGEIQTPYASDTIPCGAVVECTIDEWSDYDTRSDSQSSQLYPDSFTYVWTASAGNFGYMLPHNTGRTVYWYAPGTATSNVTITCTLTEDAVVPYGDIGYRADWMMPVAKQVTLNVVDTGARVVYVTESGSGSGASWNDAKGSVQDAVGVAAATQPYVSPKPEVWVAAGDYDVTAYNNDTLTLADGVNVYGGFAGTETERSDSRDRDTNCTTLHNHYWSAPVVTASDVTAIIDGFTIEGGYSDYGGGISAADSSLSIRYDTIQETGGGGVYISGGSASIQHSEFTSNTAGGIYCDGLNPTITYNNFYGNSNADVTVVGGRPVVAANTFLDDRSSDKAISCSGCTHATIAANTIDGCTTAGIELDGVDSATIGGNSISSCPTGIDSSDSTATIVQNTLDSCSTWGIYADATDGVIQRNTLTDCDTGIQLQDCGAAVKSNFISYGRALGSAGVCADGGTPLVANNTIRGYHCYDAARGIFVWSGSPVLANNIITCNGVGIESWGTPTLLNNDVFGNCTPYEYSGTLDTSADISADPLFDMDDLHISANSPCAGAGDNSVVAAQGDYDIDGDARKYPSNGTVDIGADETDNCEWRLEISRPSTVDVNGSINITATLKDNDGDAVVGQTVTFAVTDGSAWPQQSSDTTDANGQADTNISSSTAGWVTVRVSVATPCSNTLSADVGIGFHSAGDHDVSLVFLVDATGSTARKWQAVIDGVCRTADYLAEQLHSQGRLLRVAAIRFSDAYQEWGGTGEYLVSGNTFTAGQMCDFAAMDSADAIEKFAQWVDAPNPGGTVEYQLDILEFAKDLAPQAEPGLYIALATDEDSDSDLHLDIQDVASDLTSAGCIVFIDPTDGTCDDDTTLLTDYYAPLAVNDGGIESTSLGTFTFPLMRQSIVGQ